MTPSPHPATLPAALRLGLAAGWLLLAGQSALAMAVVGPGGTAEQGRRVAEPAPAARPAAPALDLFAARIEAVDAASGTLRLRGQAVPLHPGVLRVFGPAGQALNMRSLRAGQAVRVALEPAAPVATAAAAASAAAMVRRIVLVYIDTL